eukprot:4658748-Ditylum_brightwellii.AAC.1
MAFFISWCLRLCSSTKSLNSSCCFCRRGNHASWWSTTWCVVSPYGSLCSWANSIRKGKLHPIATRALLMSVLSTGAAFQLALWFSLSTATTGTPIELKSCRNILANVPAASSTISLGRPNGVKNTSMDSIASASASRVPFPAKATAMKE